MEADSILRLQAQIFGLLNDPRQTRLDGWNRVVDVLNRLERKGETEGGEEYQADEQRLRDLMALLRPYERLFVFPGEARVKALEERAAVGARKPLAREVRALVRRLSEFGDRAAMLEAGEEMSDGRYGGANSCSNSPRYFTVLVCDDIPASELETMRHRVAALRAEEGSFKYDIVAVDSLEDALTACLFNEDIQAVVIGHGFSLRTSRPLPISPSALEGVLREVESSDESHEELASAAIKKLWPHLDLYLVTADSALAELPGRACFSRTFYRYESLHELHAAIIAGVADRYETPFFDALRAYSRRPVGNFHALPIARGHSILSSRWIGDMAEFYGTNIFMAESSATTGGLDSLLEPTGTIKEAQKKAARAFGAERSFFVTNGTSTSNKIVLQAIVAPGDVVLIDRNCHKSHHYGLVLAGARPIYLDAYPLQSYAIYGAVSLRSMKQALLDLRRQGRLDSAKLVVLTNCTFDGIVYNPLRVMEELLAIKPDLCFLWDEAWYAFASFHPLARRRTAMFAAQELDRRFASAEYRETFDAWTRSKAGRALDDGRALDERLMPDPQKARVRVYATQSTHKSLSSFRQGSMIHVRDQDFEAHVADGFEEAFFTHTSTSPNHQIVASLDIARRQMELEGWARVNQVYQQSFQMRAHVHHDPALAKFFQILEPRDMIPAEFRASGIEAYGEGEEQGTALVRAWTEDEFVLDPSRMTLEHARTGFDGNTFKSKVLMDEFNIQINHTSINTCLFLATIGVTWGSLSWVLDALRRESAKLDHWLASATAAERQVFEARVKKLTDGLPPLPDFSEFHAAFRSRVDGQDGAIRTAYFLGNREENRRYVPLSRAADLTAAGVSLVSTNFVVPYPPGFPVLVPGQVVSAEIIDFLRKLDVKEVHGYRAELGLSVFEDTVIERLAGPQKPTSVRERVSRRHDIV